MKTTILVVALAAIMAPTFASAGALIDVTRRLDPFQPADPVADSLSHAHYDMKQLHSDAIDDVVLGKPTTTSNHGKSSNITVVAKLGPVLKCTVAGTPSEFPNDLLVANVGLVPLPVGTKLAWKADGQRGSMHLAKTLAPGKSIRLSNVLASGAEAGSACTAKAIGL